MTASRSSASSLQGQKHILRKHICRSFWHEVSRPIKIKRCVQVNVEYRWVFMACTSSFKGDIENSFMGCIVTTESDYSRYRHETNTNASSNVILRSSSNDETISLPVPYEARSFDCHFVFSDFWFIGSEMHACSLPQPIASNLGEAAYFAL
jgi:hypothetical protein